MSQDLEKIGELAFYGCSNWKQELQIPETVTQIGAYAFKECKNLNVDYNLENNNHQNYEFDGWYTDDNFTNKFTGNAEEQSTPIYVHWNYKQYKIGDVDGNGVVNATDYTMIVRYLKGYEELTPVQQLSADVDKNGTVNATDYAKLVRYLKGYETLE